jgi:hypothetical protein
MELKMFNHKRLVDVMPIHEKDLRCQSFIEGLKQEMVERNEEVLDLTEEVRFVIDNVPSRMNEPVVVVKN